MLNQHCNADKKASLITSAKILYLALSDPGIKWHIKFFAFLIVAYIVSPVDLIPDFIPVLGLLDEVILIPIALTLIVNMIPAEIYRDLSAREQVIEVDKKTVITGGLLVVSLWIGISGFIYWLI